jgi:hypothetical protein
VKGDRAEPVLERLVAEARRDAVPDMDWDAIEASLMSRLKAEPRARALPAGRSRSRGPFVLAFALAALAGAAAAAVGIVSRDRPAPAPAVAAAPQAPRTTTRSIEPRNGNALAIGDVVESGTTAVVVDHEGQATWTLEPDSSAHVEELGGVIRVALDRGVLSAKVAKSPRPESFVVRVEGTRVAVHGTVFRVSRLEHEVRVEVTEGVVGVGPVHGPSFDVAAPASATTTFEGVRTDLRHAARNVAKASEHPRAEVAQPASADETAPAEEIATAEAPPQPEATPSTSAERAPAVVSRAAQESAPVPNVDSVVDAVRRCFRERTVTNGDLHVTVNTQMALRIQANGRVGEAVFTPPLAPNVRRCVDDSVGVMHFPSSPNGFAVDKVLDLER